jgi:hypothetical protein
MSTAAASKVENEQLFVNKLFNVGGFKAVVTGGGTGIG